MRKFLGTICASMFMVGLFIVQSTPTSAQVIINNVFSPFTSIQVAPGYRRYAGPPVWRSEHPSRCYYRWRGGHQDWRVHCVRMRYEGGERHYWAGGGERYYWDDERLSDGDNY